MQTLRIAPVAGRVVRDPDLHDLITGPRTVPDSPFWRRRVRDGDVCLDDPPPSAHEPDTPLQGRIPPARAASQKRTNDEGGTQ